MTSANSSAQGVDANDAGEVVPLRTFGDRLLAERDTLVLLTVRLD